MTVPFTEHSKQQRSSKLLATTLTYSLQCDAALVAMAAQAEPLAARQVLMLAAVQHVEKTYSKRINAGRSVIRVGGRARQQCALCCQQCCACTAQLCYGVHAYHRALQDVQAYQRGLCCDLLLSLQCPAPLQRLASTPPSLQLQASLIFSSDGMIATIRRACHHEPACCLPAPPPCTSHPAWCPCPADCQQ